jgi:glycosyltransferase involved in cell wall biosynthesis
MALPVTLWTRFDPGLPGLLHHPALRAVVVPSRTEPLGRIPLEAFAAGAGPVVATTAGGLAETVLDAITGYTAPPGAPQALAEALHKALTAPPYERERLRAAGAELVAARDYTTCVTGVLSTLAPWARAADAKP